MLNKEKLKLDYIIYSLLLVNLMIISNLIKDIVIRDLAKMVIQVIVPPIYLTYFLLKTVERPYFYQLKGLYTLERCKKINWLALSITTFVVIFPIIASHILLIRIHSSIVSVTLLFLITIVIEVVIIIGSHVLYLSLIHSISILFDYVIIELVSGDYIYSIDYPRNDIVYGLVIPKVIDWEKDI